jgi:V/A-type H+-transporting ATPase subunit A
VVEEGYAFSLITKTGLFDRLSKMKYEVSNDELDKFDQYYDIIDDALKEIK